jgi:hypothetical protein
VTSQLGQSRAALSAARVHGHHDRNSPIRRRGDPMHIDSPFVPGPPDVVEVLPDPLVPDVSASTDRQKRDELDLRMTYGKGCIDVVASDRVGKPAHLLLVVGSHPRQYRRLGGCGTRSID